MELNTRPPKYKIVKLVGANVWRVVYWKPWGWLKIFNPYSSGRWKTAKMERMGMHGIYTIDCEYDAYYLAEKACTELEDEYNESEARNYDMWLPVREDNSNVKES